MSRTAENIPAEQIEPGDVIALNGEFREVRAVNKKDGWVSLSLPVIGVLHIESNVIYPVWRFSEEGYGTDSIPQQSPEDLFDEMTEGDIARGTFSCTVDESGGLADSPVSSVKPKIIYTKDLRRGDVIRMQVPGSDHYTLPLRVEEVPSEGSEVGGRVPYVRLIPVPGRRIRLVRVDDPYTKLRPGDEGTIMSYSAINGAIGVEWDSGSCLSLLIDVDEWEVLPPKE